jgi:mRNA-degrading endonuclease RelE of RelBE toxin-antitoxin system
MSDMSVQLKFTALFKRRLKGLAKKYGQIQTDIQPVLDEIIQGNLIGNQITETQYIVYKVRAKNSDAQVGKSGGYRLIDRVESPTQVVLHLIYSKSEQANVSAEDIQSAIAQYQLDSDD